MSKALLITHVNWEIYYQPALFARALCSIYDEVHLLKGRQIYKFSEGQRPNYASKGDGSYLSLAISGARAAALTIGGNYELVVAFDLGSIVPGLPLISLRKDSTLCGIYFLEHEDDGYQTTRRNQCGLKWLRQKGNQIDFVIDTNHFRLKPRNWINEVTRTFIVPNAMFSQDFPVLRNDRLERFPRLIYTGTTATFSCLPQLIKAIRLCKHRVKLDLYLHTEDRDLNRLTNDLELCAQVHIYSGVFDDEMKIRTPQQYNIGVVFSAEAGAKTINRQQCSPNKLGEYLASGLACLVSTNESLQFIPNNDLGIQVDSLSPESIASGIDTLCRNDQFVRMGGKARRYFESDYCFNRNIAPVLEWIASRRSSVRNARS